jgi:hypothetical protein
MVDRAPMTPTQRSLAYLREQGYTCAVVEHWNAHRRIRQDLFGFIDILAIREGETLAVQTTTTGVAERVRKITDSPNLAAVRSAGWAIHVHGWRKIGKPPKIALRTVDLS